MPLFFLTIHCHKESEYYQSSITGTVVSTFDDKPIPGATAELVELIGDIGSSGAYKVLDSMVVDANGKFHFDYTGKNNVLYAVRGRHSRYLYVDYSVAYLNRNGATHPNNFAVSLIPYSYTKVTIKDTSGNGLYRGVYFFANWAVDDVAIFKNPIDTSFIARDTYTYIVLSWQLLYSDNRRGPRNIEPLVCKPLDTCAITIKF